MLLSGKSLVTFTKSYTFTMENQLSYLKDGLHIWPDEARGIGDQMTKHTGALLFVPANTTVLQLC